MKYDNEMNMSDTYNKIKIPYSHIEQLLFNKTIGWFTNPSRSRHNIIVFVDWYNVLPIPSDRSFICFYSITSFIYISRFSASYYSRSSHVSYVYLFLFFQVSFIQSILVVVVLFLFIFLRFDVLHKSIMIFLVHHDIPIQVW